MGGVPLLIAQMTDIHIGFDPEALPEELNRSRFRATLTRLIDTPNRPDLLVMSGDLTDRGDRDSFEKIEDLLEHVPCPILPMVGNHDTREGLLHAFPETLRQGGFIHYVHEIGGLAIVCLDTLEPGRHGGAFCEERRDWLQAPPRGVARCAGGHFHASSARRFRYRLDGPVARRKLDRELHCRHRWPRKPHTRDPLRPPPPPARDELPRRAADDYPFGWPHWWRSI